MEEKDRIARIAKKVAAAVNLAPVDMTQETLSKLNRAHNDNEYSVCKDELWDYADIDLSVSDFADSAVADGIFTSDANGKPMFRAVFAVNCVAVKEYWSGRHNDYSPSYEYGLVAYPDEFLVFASVENAETNDFEHFDITGLLSQGCISQIRQSIEKQGKYDSSEADSLTIDRIEDDF